jgi:hypothetical protein
MIGLSYNFMFSPEIGCLYHPNGYDTSWLVFRDGKWVPEEWACYLEPSLVEKLLTEINQNDS